ncbi:molecular chaperone [Atlantibacter subterranea]|uniref:fimbrial biogenesis chaperone n=1 Tax=Atlantibacter subterraneus TaxID=255519 RepID=UPI001183AFE1|nr:molecular chaperone [Atlantibacter subterranea]TSJ58006.1 molecular chaperone [Atlantibacter subterranea]
MLKSCYAFSSLLALWLLVSAAGHGAVNVNASRVIFNQGATQAAVSLINDGDYPVVVQAWMDNGDPRNTPDNASAPFVVLPPVFRLNSAESKLLRILTHGAGLPGDRESLFWLNIYQIPPESRAEPAGEKLRLALRTQLKVMWRPKGVGPLERKTVEKITFIRQAGSIIAINDSPWNISLIDVRYSKYSLRAGVIPAFSQTVLVPAMSPEPSQNKINFSVINDDGNTWEFTASVK